jgi:hypothetical protein
VVWSVGTGSNGLIATGVDVALYYSNKFVVLVQFSSVQLLIDSWMPSTEPQDDGAAEDIQESAEAALAATSQGI